MRQKKLSGDDALVLVRELKKDAPVAERQVLKIYYRSNQELITALEEKLQDLRAQSPVEQK